MSAQDRIKISNGKAFTLSKEIVRFIYHRNRYCKEVYRI